MNTIIKFCWAVVLGSLVLASCGQDEAKPEEMSSAATTTQSVSQSSEPASQSEPKSESAAESSQPGGRLSDNYIETVTGDKYYMRFRSTTNLAEEELTAETAMAVADDKTAIHSTTADTDATILMMDGNTYMIDHINQTVFTMPATDAGEETTIPEIEEATEATTMDDLTYVGSGKEDGLVYEEYRTESGTRIFNYFDGSELKKIKTIDEEFESVMEILELSEKVPADAFEIPADYQTLEF